MTSDSLDLVDICLAVGSSDENKTADTASGACLSDNKVVFDLLAMRQSSLVSADDCTDSLVAVVVGSGRDIAAADSEDGCTFNFDDADKAEAETTPAGCLAVVDDVDDALYKDVNEVAAVVATP